MKKIVVVGNGMTSFKFCEKLVAKKANQIFQITVFGEEIRPAYDRVHLSEYFSGKTADDLIMAPARWYAENNIILHLGNPIQSINRVLQTVTSHNGITIPYDFLVMATGSAAYVPTIPGVEKNGVFIYRTIEDLEMITAWSRRSQKAAVIGGGL